METIKKKLTENIYITKTKLINNKNNKQHKINKYTNTNNNKYKTKTKKQTQ